MKITKEERDIFRRMGKRGGAARAKSLTPKQRSEQARKAVNTRWNKETAKK